MTLYVISVMCVTVIAGRPLRYAHSLLLTRHLDLKVLTEIQRKAHPAVLSGGDTVILDETGTGKTLAYLLPVLDALIRDRAEAPTFTGPYDGPPGGWAWQCWYGVEDQANALALEDTLCQPCSLGELPSVWWEERLLPPPRAALRVDSS